MIAEGLASRQALNHEIWFYLNMMQAMICIHIFWFRVEPEFDNNFYLEIQVQYGSNSKKKCFEKTDV